MGKLTKFGCLGILVFGFLGAIVTESRAGEGEHATPTATAATTPTGPTVSAIMWTDVEAIYGAKSGSTDLKKSASWEGLKGKRVRWGGLVAGVETTLGKLVMRVKMNPETRTHDLRIVLRDGEKSKAADLNNGEYVTFEATLQKYGGRVVAMNLDDGAIVTDDGTPEEDISAFFDGFLKYRNQPGKFRARYAGGVGSPDDATSVIKVDSFDGGMRTEQIGVPAKQLDAILAGGVEKPALIIETRPFGGVPIVVRVSAKK